MVRLYAIPFLLTRGKELFGLPELVTLKGVREARIYSVKREQAPRLALVG